MERHKLSQATPDFRMTIKDAKQLLAGHHADPLIEAVDAVLGSMEFDAHQANNQPGLRGRDRHFNAGRSAAVADCRSILAQVSRGSSKLG